MAYDSADVASNLLASGERFLANVPVAKTISPYVGILGNKAQGFYQNGRNLSTADYLGEIAQDAAYSSLGELAGDYLTYKNLSKIKAPTAPYNWIRPLARGGLYGAAGALAFEGGYELGRQLDNKYDVSGYWARQLVPSVDPNSPEQTAYRNSQDYRQNIIDSIIRRAVNEHNKPLSAQRLRNFNSEKK